MLLFSLDSFPCGFEQNQAIEQRDAAQLELRLIQMQKTVGTAIADVQRGEYEPARQTMSDFYTNLRSQIDAEGNSLFTPTQREKPKTLLRDREEVITSLAQGNVTAGDRLSSVYTSYSS